MTNQAQYPVALFTPARIIALTFIALGVLGLVYLRLTSGTSAVSIPAGAHAGQLKLTPCKYTTEKGSSSADCGTLIVPENRHNPHSRLIALPVIRIRATSAHPSNPIFRLQGGPGITNMVFPAASRFTANHDVVLVGYRGVDGSSVLNCPEVTSALEHSADMLGQASFRAYADGFRACATRLTAHGVDLAGYTIPERVDDLEAARKALGYKQIDLVSESAGTRTAMIYAWMHPTSIHRSVMIGANPPGRFPFDRKTIDLQFQRYARLCAADAACSKAHQRSHRHLQAHGRQHARPLLVPPYQEGGCAGRDRIWHAGVDGRRRPTRRADDDRLMGIGRPRRPERAVVPIDVCRPRFPTGVCLG